MTADISALLQNEAQFAASFEEEANFCAGATQIHTHSPTCVKYSLKRGVKGSLCRFKAPWPNVAKTAFTEEGVLQIRRSHNLVNRWNKAIAVGLRHNHDISFIGTQRKTMSLMYYITNYATKVEDPIWKRLAVASEFFPMLKDPVNVEQTDGAPARAASTGVRNRTRQFLMRIANRIFTDQPLSQVEVIAHLLGYGMEFTANDQWTFLNVTSLYWQIAGQWSLLQEGGEMDLSMRSADETVFLEETGRKISFADAYPHRGKILQGLSFYDYMSVVKLKRKRKEVGGSGEIEFQSTWVFSAKWVQELRKPGKFAMVCLDGYLSMDFSEEEGQYHRRYG